MPNLESYDTAGCPYTCELREWLRNGHAFVEFDVEADADARRRLRAFGEISLGQAALAALCGTVPVAVDSRGTNRFWSA